MVQMLLVDRVTVGTLDVDQVGERRRLEETVSELSVAISNGLVVETGDEGAEYGVTSMRQCTSGAGDLNADCGDGTTIATAPEQDWFSANSVTIISVCVVVFVVYAFFAFPL